MTLPCVVSVPHAGRAVPPEVRNVWRLTPEEVVEDGDVGAREIYAVSGYVQEFVTTEVARAAVDLNRAPDDRRQDGVVKTHTCWDVPVYTRFPEDGTVATLLRRYYHPYHRRLRRISDGGHAALGLDCHTMAAVGPPVGPDPGIERPAICVSDGDGTTCPPGWTSHLATCLERAFEDEVRINSPFSGGFITRHHGRTMPWIQVEMSRAPFLDLEEKRERFVAALTRLFATLRFR